MKIWLLFILTLCSKVTISCPICHTTTGQLVRAGIFNSTFFLYFFYTLLPFFCFFLIISAAYYKKIPLIG